MFTIPSLAKIIVAVGAVALVLWGFRMRDMARKDSDGNARRPRRRAAEKTDTTDSQSNGRTPDSSGTAVHPTYMCQLCDAYVLRGEACTRPDCPNQKSGTGR